MSEKLIVQLKCCEDSCDTFQLSDAEDVTWEECYRLKVGKENIVFNWDDLCEALEAIDAHKKDQELERLRNHV